MCIRDRIRKPSVRESIMRNSERLRINYRLIKLGEGAALPFELQDLEYCDGKKTTNEVLKGIGLR